MKPVGPDTPIGTLCLFVGPAPEFSERIGSAVKIETHLAGNIFGYVTAKLTGLYYDVRVRAESDGTLGLCAYSDLVIMDDGDPDAATREIEKERETC